MSWAFKTLRSSAVSVLPAPYSSALQSAAEWTAAIVCPDNALQSSLMSSQAKRAQKLKLKGLYFLPYPGTKMEVLIKKISGRACFCTLIILTGSAET